MPSPANLRRDEPLAVVQPKRHEVLGIVCLAAAFLVGLALASFDVRGGADWAGPVGFRVAESLVAFLGTAAALLPLSLSLLAVRLFRRTVAPFRLARVLGSAAIVVVVATALHLWLGERPALGGLAAGGLLGSTLGEGLRAAVGTAGANTLVITALLVALVLLIVLAAAVFVVIPLLVALLDVLLVVLLSLLGVVARIAFRRPWTIEAVASDDTRLAWHVVGWKQSGALVRDLADRLRVGVPLPEPGAWSQAPPGAT